VERIDMLVRKLEGATEPAPELGEALQDVKS
jgi:hypothetical protein